MNQQTSADASFDDATSVLTLTGDIDEGAGVALRDAIVARTENFTRSISIELSQVDYFPSLAVGVVANALSRAHQAGTEIVLVAEQGTVAQRVLTVCGLEHQTA